MKGDNIMIDRIKYLLIVFGVFLLVVYCVYYALFKKTDEIGFLGAGKIGRQVFIQTMNEYGIPDIEVKSDFFDHNILERIIIGEPLRTTIRFNIQNDQKVIFDRKMTEAYLNQPYNIITDIFRGKIVMQEEYSLSSKELINMIKNNRIVTIEDLFAGLGFKRFEIHIKGVPQHIVIIRKTRNVGHVGGE
jgi:hypothetical protein